MLSILIQFSGETDLKETFTQSKGNFGKSYQRGETQNKSLQGGGGREGINV